MGAKWKEVVVVGQVIEPLDKGGNRISIMYLQSATERGIVGVVQH